MQTKKVREMIFFLLLPFLYYFSGKVVNYWVIDSNIPYEKSLLYMSIIFAILIFVIFSLMKTGVNQENFWDIDPGARCKGGAYMHQGDSETSRMCRAMAKTNEGRCAIASYQCPTGYIGSPRAPFVYTPVSDDNWKNEMCMHDMPYTECSECARETMSAFVMQTPLPKNVT